MNKSMLMGLVGGISIATAGGVAGYAFLSGPAGVTETGGAAVLEAIAEPSSVAEEATQVQVTAAPSAPVPAPSAQAAAQQAPVEQECWDEEVTVQADPKDDNAIAGTAAGAVIGGALAKKLGDDRDLVTAAGAAAGAFAGRRLQRRVQESNTVTTTERRCAPAQ